MRASHASSKYMEGAPNLSMKAVKKEKWQKGLMVKIKSISVEELAEA
jgi:hypothetical protein